jgi:riboflavin synthase
VAKVKLFTQLNNALKKFSEFCSMFTGIIENTGILKDIHIDGSNRTFFIEAAISAQLSVDQSVSHDGVCLTVENTHHSIHQVTAIEETLKKTTLKNWEIGKIINLERCIQLSRLMDGHIVQGHVDGLAICSDRIIKEGSWEFQFSFDRNFAALIIEKGSVCINGISLTAFNVSENYFTVAIIPYTLAHTNLQSLEVGMAVNVEFDVLGKYVQRMLQLKH